MLGPGLQELSFDLREILLDPGMVKGKKCIGSRLVLTSDLGGSPKTVSLAGIVDDLLEARP